MDFDAWFTLFVVVATLIVLSRDLLPPAAVVLAATTSLLVAGVIDEEQAFSGFSNSAPLTVAALYVLARAVEKTGALGPMVSNLLGNPRAVGRAALVRLLGPTAGASAFINNTPLVGMLIPEVTRWAGKRGVSPSRLLLPISYAAILGGTLTVIGTSTNLVVSGLLQEAGGEPLGIFEITPLGAVVAFAGLTTLIALAPRLIPDRRAVDESVGDEIREFSVQMMVDPRGKLDEVTVEDAGLRHLEGVYLAEIQRGDRLITPVNPDRTLRGGDRLVFVGRSDLVVDLQRTPGLSSVESEHMHAIDSPQHTFFETVVGAGSVLVGQTLEEADFRRRYAAVVVAIHRAGERLRAKLGQQRIKAGDTLLLLSDPDFRRRNREGRDFLLVARIGGPSPSASRKAPLVAAIAGAIIALAALDVLPILQGALLAAAALIGTRVLTFAEARNSIDLDVVLLIAAAFGLGAAIETTGLADDIANALVTTFDGLGTAGIIFGIVLATTLLTELITNNAAAVVIFPIAIAIAAASGLDERTVAIAVAVTASSSFLTPMGYQTNTMVYGPGGYRFTDYLRVGIPLNVVVAVVITGFTAAVA
ncbi:MAG: SLC13 family permease [Solirubrobacterales bacterium]|nr:SLC13 family permease [Solirubrobacterales bacterium]